MFGFLRNIFSPGGKALGDMGAKVQPEVTISAVVIRADGRKEDKGIISRGVVTRKGAKQL